MNKPPLIYCPFCEMATEAQSYGISSEIFAVRDVVDAGPRPLAKCGVCRAVERERMLKWCMEREMTARDYDLLHFAPSGATWKWLAGLDNVTSTEADIDPTRYRFIKDMVEADILDLPFKDSSFDLILCSHVMEHIDDDVRAFRELSRVLRPDGSAFLMVPLIVDGKGPLEDPTITTRRRRRRRFGQGDHVRIYDADLFVRRATEGGLEIEVFDPFAIDPAYAVAIGVGQGNVVFVARPAD